MVRARKIFNKYDTIFNRLVLSFIGLVLLVCVCMSIGYATQFSSKYREKVEILEKEKLEYLGERLDQLFDNCNTIITDLADMSTRDEDINHFLSHSSPSDYASMSTIQKYLQIKQTQNDKEIDGIDFYIFSNKMRISSLSGISLIYEDKEDIINRFDTAGYCITYKSSNRYIFKRTITANGVSTEVLTFGSHYPIFTKNISRVRGYMAVNIPIHYIQQMLTEYADDNGSYVALVDEAGEMIVEGGDLSLVEQVLEGLSGEEKMGVISSVIEDPYTSYGMILAGQGMHMLGWKVISVTSTKEYYSEIYALVRQMILLTGLIMIVGLALAYKFARRIYSPIDSMVMKLSSMKISKRARENELKYIDRTIDELVVLVENKEEAMRDHVLHVQHEMVRKLINSADFTDEEIDETLERIGGSNKYTCHYAFAITLPCRVLGKLDDVTRNAITYNITRYLEEYSVENLRCMSLNLHSGKIIAVVSLINDKSKLDRTLTVMLTDYAKMNLGIDIVIWKSNPVYAMSDIHDELTKLFKAMEYSYFLPYYYYIDMADMEQTKIDMLLGDKDTACYFNPRFEEFSEALVSQNAETVNSILVDYNNAAAEIRGTYEFMNMISMRYLFLFNYFLRNSMKKSKDYDDSKLFLEIGGIYDVDNYCKWLYGKVLWAFETMAAGEEKPSHNVVSLIENIVKEHLSEDISLDYVARKVYLAPKYLSRLFKEEMDINFTQYVNHCKMVEAEKLLAETEKTLEEIIANIGFKSSTYFIKKFKESYGMTPTQYRRNKRIEKV